MQRIQHKKTVAPGTYTYFIHISIQFTVAPTEKARRKQNQTKYKISAESLYVDLVERWLR